MKYHAIIIGSGQGGTPLARRLADLGRTVALIERKEQGVFCITPRKGIFQASASEFVGFVADRDPG